MDTSLDTSFDLDLQAVISPSKRIKMPNGDTVEVKAPSLRKLIEMGTLMKRWQSQATKIKSGIEGGETAEALELISELIEKIENLIPEMKGYDLELDQLMLVVKVAMALAEPAHAKELARRGISVAGSSKKNSR